ncbi:alpha/beta fold hydrolase [Propioniferax innocua]|uniref:Pimeloyl-ACP methyl ester carboxylesterase n=1 Tax=Propioniferax innocua TaxID=1753 RepID=A0A542ZQG8_9ACTN|nr:alpha/beta hydrolase [Propioniferax innocua]TQL62602.1 pimeloyl-ACP methyl ester carboxylesterase [Propioniferax innocua]
MVTDDQQLITLARVGSLLHAWSAGDPNHPAVVLSHGAAMDHRTFDPNLHALLEAGYRVLTWDIRGHGRSKPLGKTPISVEDMVDDLIAVLDHFDVNAPACIGGHSLGGYIAQKLVKRAPERVAALVIIGSTCTTMPITRMEKWALQSSPQWFRPWPWGHLKRTIAQSTARHQHVRDYAAEAAAALTKDEFLAIWHAVSHCIHPEPDYRIEVPLLLTHGAQDRTGNVARSAPKWAARDPHCTYSVIPDASHNAHQDNPEFFNQVLLDFLIKHFPGAAT